MKKRHISVLTTLLVLLAMTLAACGGSEFRVSENTEKKITLEAANADSESFLMTGTLTVAEGEQIRISSSLTKGKIRLELFRTAEEQSADSLPEIGGDVAISADLASGDGPTAMSYRAEAGDYMIKAACLEKATGTVEIEAVAGSGEESAEESEAAEEIEGIDYLALVNKLHPLPDGWESALAVAETTNSVGDTVEVEEKAYAAYLQLKADLEENDGIYLELDSARRSVAAQQDIMDRFIEKYGADYAAKTVAQPGYSEHHTGLALDLYFRLQEGDGTFTDVYYNEDMVQYPEIWEKIHAKLADYGFILRYLDGREHITGYGYEPWHIRYVDSPEIAKEIMDRDITLEEYLGGYRAPAVTIDYGKSDIYSQEELEEAVVQIKCGFASWEGCELHSLRYAGDEADNAENLEWLNSHGEGLDYTHAAEFLGDFHTPAENAGAWNPDEEYKDYQWWLARTRDGGWEVVDWGY